MRKQIAAGNWKMNKTIEEGQALVSALLDVKIPEGVEVILGVPYLLLPSVREMTKASEIKVAAQNCHQEESGAYTGEISAPMLAALGIEHVIIGHSERREYFHETNAILAQKVDVALKNDLGPIFCCGESLDIREAGHHIEHVKKQLQEGLFHLDKDQLLKIVIAYEPIWAIGTGVTASREQAQEMHHEIRKMLVDKYGSEVADEIAILYGGSVKPGNASELFGEPDVDGGLVGGASLKAEDFKAIILA